VPIVAHANPHSLAKVRGLCRGAIHAVQVQPQVARRKAEAGIKLPAVKHQQPAAGVGIGVDLHFHLVGVIAIHKP
jgi:hypothetical protein